MIRDRRRLKDDPFPPPPGRAHGPGECMACRTVKTMHARGMCSTCGDWVTRIDAASVLPGDLMFDWIDWGTVEGLRRDGDRMLISLAGRRKPVRIGAGSTVYVAKNRPQA